MREGREKEEGGMGRESVGAGGWGRANFAPKLEHVTELRHVAFGGILEGDFGGRTDLL